MAKMGRRQFAALTMLALIGCATQPWQTVKLTAPAYNNETYDFGVAPTSSIRTASEGYDGPTPTTIAGARTITTPQLRDMLRGPSPPLLIDAIGGHQTVSLSGATWLPGVGTGRSLNDGLHARFGAFLTEATHGDKAGPIVLFCLSQVCWLSHNATVRAVALGYKNVYWYRGGRDAWEAAGLAMKPVSRTRF